LPTPSRIREKIKVLFSMADVSKIQGPSGAPESFGKKDRDSVDSEKFKEAMRRRVTEVSQIDPDEQKKRKRREEAEEEEPLQEMAEGPATPASQVTPFSLEKEKMKPMPPGMHEGAGISPTASAQKTTLPSPPTKASFQAHSTDEMADDSGMLEEDSFTENAPPPPEPAAAPPVIIGGTEEAPPPEQPVLQAPFQPLQPQQPRASEEMTPQAQRPVVTPPPESGQPETGQRPPERKSTQRAAGTPPEKKRSVPGIEPRLTGLRTEQQKQAGAVQEKPGMTPAAMEDAQPSKVEDTTGFFEQLGKEGGGENKGGQQTKKPEDLEEEAEIQGVGAPGQPSPFAQTLEGKGEKKVEDKETSKEPGGLLMAGTPGEAPGAQVPSPPQPLPPYANLHPQVMEIFDRMVGVMTVMSMSGMTETVMTLNTPQFASSVFFGTQIIIQEFSTAPQAFNIQINGTPQAVALFQGNVDDLMAAFQAGNYNFRVNRLETGYLTERPLFKRKEKSEGKEGDKGSQGEK
jgi:hypothetical protein